MAFGWPVPRVQLGSRFVRRRARASNYIEDGLRTRDHLIDFKPLQATMATTSSLLLHLHLHPFPKLLHTSTTLPSITFHLHKSRKISTISSASPNSSWDETEESQEQRWLREQSRWNTERDSLLQEISNLKSQIQFLSQHTDSLPAELVSSENAKKRIAEIGSGPVPMLLEEVKETIVEEIRVLKSADEVVDKKARKIRKQIRKGAEGEDVRAMQEALMKLGFYSGEEEMEFSSFSDDTERAIKSWQASIEIREDGMMTAELLEKLFTEAGEENSISTEEKDSTNGATVASVTKISEAKDIALKESGHTEVDPKQHRVFLLGENRWEDSSRLTDKNKQNGGSTTGISTTKCIACRGEGHILCSECDGTGEPNVEEQFLEWIDEGAKCLYCEGLGYSICDVCEGKTIISA
ncbi:hypothetical protein ACHQM5_027882 [Ranunculus cassubicifolius]